LTKNTGVVYDNFKMKRLLILLLTVAGLLTLTAPALADDQSVPFWQKSDELIVVEENEVVDRDFYGGAGRVEIYGVVNGDVFTVGGQILINGVVNGDVLAAGGTVDVGGTVSQDVRIVGGQLMISGQIGKNVTFVGGNVQTLDSARIGGSILGAGGSAIIASPVAKNVTVGTGNLILSSQIGGDVEAGVGSLRLTPEAEILGDLTYWSDNEASIASGATVGGEITKKEPARGLTDFNQEAGVVGLKGAWKGFKTFLTFTSAISSLIIGLIFLLLFPKFSQEAAEIISRKPLSVFGLGLAGLVVIPPLALILLLTVFGIPLAVILLTFYFFSIYLSKIFVAIFIGGFILTWLKVKTKLIWTFIIGLAVYFLIRNLIFVGWLVTLLSLFFGLGAFWLSLRNSIFLSGKKK